MSLFRYRGKERPVRFFLIHAISRFSYLSVLNPCSASVSKKLKLPLESIQNLKE
jgi:hypothetical protein